VGRRRARPTQDRMFGAMAKGKKMCGANDSSERGNWIKEKKKGFCPEIILKKKGGGYVTRNSGPKKNIGSWGGPARSGGVKHQLYMVGAVWARGGGGPKRRFGTQLTCTITLWGGANDEGRNRRKRLCIG